MRLVINAPIAPSMSLIPAWTLSESALLPVAAAPLALMAAERVAAPRAHQAHVQAELGEAVLMLDSNKGTTGFEGSNVSVKRRYTDGSGVPPRGRPV
ncbi:MULTISPECIES: hypothetical protein [Actinoplanes]|uniref:hypothetical protein n=1 Tax=Actinoplanes TaxID=1865 RepID=UPI000B1C0F33|nr:MULTISPECIES: hypothetical protein [Actinoplanes]